MDRQRAVAIVLSCLLFVGSLREAFSSDKHLLSDTALQLYGAVAIFLIGGLITVVVRKNGRAFCLLLFAATIILSSAPFRIRDWKAQKIKAERERVQYLAFEQGKGHILNFAELPSGKILIAGHGIKRLNADRSGFGSHSTAAEA
ncbi:hypothetical protein [Bryobacter aggregatus]|uniref:hypothetical protein n=1 Tax=Bryobacter aggregatus TaxID=360054 RepID=UPI0004E1E137|nr:hypothetical protein [Bryobacter aggregatus]